ncbi:hypothetical protein C0995_012312, partial [Termitomyces sp. Mi166
DGGTRGLSELIILQEIMHRLKYLENTPSVPKPCDYFDIIGGVGTGGIIALMLGRLCMPIDLAIEKYVNFSKKVYSDIKIFSMGSERFKASTFVSEMEDILRSAGLPVDILMQEEKPSCKRSYEVRANQGYNCSVVEAARATTATPELFKAVSIGSGGLWEEFVGSHLGYNNPTSLVLEEAELLFGATQYVACIVNIGAGHPGHVSWKPTKSFTQRLVKVLFDISTNSEVPVEDFLKRCQNLPGTFYRLNVDQGLQKMALDDWNKLGEIKTHSVNYLQKLETTQKINSLVNTLHNMPQKVTLGALIEPVLTSTSKADVLSQLEEYFVDGPSSLELNLQQHFVLYGLGGAGKTQIVLQFCYRFKNRFSFIYMIDASSKESIEHFLVQVAHKAKLAEDTPAAALVWLCYQTTEWLMIFDNADDPDLDLWKFFPVCSHGNILITSRNEACTKYASEHFYKVGEMTNEDSLAILFKTSTRVSLSESEHAAAQDLVQELGHLALAIVQAGILERAWNNLAKYSQMNIQEIKEVLELFVTEDGNWDNHSLEEALDALQSYSLVEITGEGVAFLEIHSLVHLWSYKSLPLEEQAKAQICVQQLFYCISQGERSYSDVIQWVPHIQSLLQVLVKNEIDVKAADAMGQIFGEAHLWNEAAVLQRQIIQIQTKALGDFHLDTIKTMTNLTATLGKARKFQEAESLGQQVLKTCIDAFGSSHSETIKVMANFAIILRMAGKLKEAENLGQQAWEACSEAFGNNHPNTIQTMENLALTQMEAGMLQEAENLERHVLDAQKETFGSSHPNTIKTMANLVTIIMEAGRLEEAENFGQQVLKTFTEVFGSSHPSTISLMANLVVILTQVGKLDEAENLGQQVLEAMKAGRLQKAENVGKQVLKICTDTFGSSHPDTIKAMVNFAGAMRKAGKLQEAENIGQQAMKAHTEAFGSDHPGTIVAMASFATTLTAAGKLQEAENLHQQVYKACTEICGSDHPTTMKVMKNLVITLLKAGKLQEAKSHCQQVQKSSTKAFQRSSGNLDITNLEVDILVKAGKLEEAENLERQVLKCCTETVGSSHSSTIATMDHLATILTKAGKLQEAENLNKQVLRAWTEVFGSNHPNTMRVMKNLAITLIRAGKVQEAENLQQQVLKTHIEILGSSHPDTIMAMANLAVILMQLGELQKAENLNKQALKAQTEMFGSSHSNTVKIMTNLATTLIKATKLQEAENFQQQVLKTHREISGSSHPDTITAIINLAVILLKAGKLQEFENIQQEILTAHAQAFDTNHPNIIKAMEHLIKTLKEARKLCEAENFQQQILRAYTEAFGNSHPNTIKGMQTLAVILFKAGKVQEAENLQQQVLNAYTEAFSSSHPNTITAMANLVTILLKAGKLQEAENIQWQVLDAYIEAFGNNHLDTFKAMKRLATILLKAGKLQEAKDLIQEVARITKQQLATDSQAPAQFDAQNLFHSCYLCYK